MNVLLVSLQKELDVTGLKSLHYNLLNNGYNSFILHLPKLAQNNKRQLEEIKRFINEIDPSVIGISLMSHEYHKACYLTRYLKSLSIKIENWTVFKQLKLKTGLAFLRYTSFKKGGFCYGANTQTVFNRTG